MGQEYKRLLSSYELVECAVASTIKIATSKV